VLQLCNGFWIELSQSCNTLFLLGVSSLNSAWFSVGGFGATQLIKESNQGQFVSGRVQGFRRSLGG
jgi:hypothetical protein